MCPLMLRDGWGRSVTYNPCMYAPGTSGVIKVLMILSNNADQPAAEMWEKEMTKVNPEQAAGGYARQHVSVSCH